MDLKDINKRIKEHNTDCDTDDSTKISNFCGYTSTEVKDKTILPVTVSGKISLHFPLSGIEDPYVRLMVERDYATLTSHLETRRKELVRMRSEIEDIQPKSVLRLTPNKLKQLKDEKRLYLEKGGERYILLPVPVDLKIGE